MGRDSRNRVVNNTVTYTLRVTAPLTLVQANVTGTTVGVTPNNGSSLSFSNPTFSNITYTFPYLYMKQINTTTNFSVNGNAAMYMSFNQFNYMYNLSVVNQQVYPSL